MRGISTRDLPVRGLPREPAVGQARGHSSTLAASMLRVRDPFESGAGDGLRPSAARPAG